MGCYNKIDPRSIIELMKQIFKKIALAFFGFVILAILFSPQPALAGVWDWIVGAITFLPNAIINLAFQILVLFWGALATLAGVILKWVVSPGFISWSYTSADPTKNPIIAIGYNITRSFVNMGLVLVLVYIAFSTILRLGGRQTQKLLITLIVVALLVNFAPVLCGLVVDATNIAMYYFTDHITGMKNLLNTLKGAGDSIVAGFTTLEATKQFGILFQSVALIAFNMVLTFILLLFAIIFLLRYVAIWVAVILAPLAFVSYILPATRRFFNTWLSQFLQWSIIGVAGGFFLYLGEQIAELMPTAPMLRAETEYGIFDTILPHFVTLAFLGIGLIVALTTSAMGAGQIMAGGKRFGKTMGPTVAKWTAQVPKAGYRMAAAPLTAAVGKGKETYQAARAQKVGRIAALGWGIKRGASAVREKGAIMEEVKRAVPKRPPEGYVRAARTGLKAALSQSWKAAIHPKKKRKLTVAEKAAEEVEEKA